MGGSTSKPDEKAPAPSEASSLLTKEGATSAAQKRIGEVVARLGVVVASVLLFMVCSCSMLIVNKLVIKKSGLPFTVVEIQMAFSVVAMLCLPWTLRFGGGMRDVWRWARVLPWTFTAVLCTSMLALNYSSAGAVVVVRNLGPLISLPLERVFNEHVEIDAPTILSLVVIIMGVGLCARAQLSAQIRRNSIPTPLPPLASPGTWSTTSSSARSASSSSCSTSSRRSPTG